MFVEKCEVTVIFDVWTYHKKFNFAKITSGFIKRVWENWFLEFRLKRDNQNKINRQICNIFQYALRVKLSKKNAVCFFANLIFCFFFQQEWGCLFTESISWSKKKSKYLTNLWLYDLIYTLWLKNMLLKKIKNYLIQYKWSFFI